MSFQQSETDGTTLYQQLFECVVHNMLEDPRDPISLVFKRSEHMASEAIKQFASPTIHPKY